MKKKVLFILSTLNTGGAQRAFSNVIMGLPDDWEIDILLNDACDIVYPYKGNIIDLGFLPKANKNSVFYQGKVFVKRFFKLKELKRKKGYIASVSALESANVVNILSGNKYCKTIVSLREYRSAPQKRIPLKKVIDFLIRKLYNKADKVIAVSKGIQEDLIINYGIRPQKITTIYNGYPIKEIHKKATEENNLHEMSDILNESPVLITVGRLSVEKGYDHLLRVVSIVKKKIRDVHLVFIGDGELRNEIEELAELLEIRNSISFLGFQKNPFSIVSKAKLFVLSSYWEGFPNALAEALVCGVPCVSVDCKTGPREIMMPDTEKKDFLNEGSEDTPYGVLCPVFKGKGFAMTKEIADEEEIMAKEIVDLLLQKDKYKQKKKAIPQLWDSLSIDTAVSQWIEVICE